MKTFLISDNKDTFLGMKLAGIEGIVLNDSKEIKKEIIRIEEEQEVEILFITENILNKAKDEFMDIKLNKNKPLVVEIPDRHGSESGGDKIVSYIKDMVGIKI